ADGMRGAQATAQIAQRADAPRVLVLTTYDTDADILAAIEAGAAGYLLKDVPPEEIASAIRRAAGGQSALEPSIADRLTDRARRSATMLSGREIEVLKIV